MPSDEMTPAEIGRVLSRIDTTVTSLATELRTEMQNTRHKANEALHGVQLQREKNIYVDEKLDSLVLSNERQWTTINDLRENAASREAVERYKRWLFGGGALMALLNIVGLVVAIAT